MGIKLAGKVICATDADVDIVRNHLPDHIRLSRAEPACVSFDVTQDTDNPLIWHVSEEFTDRAGFDAHQIRTKSSLWFKKTAHIPREYVINEC